MAPAGLEAVLDHPDRFLKPPARLLVSTELITLGVVPPLASGAAPLLLRRLNYGRRLHRWRDVFRPTRVERAFRHGLALERAGVATPPVVAVGVERWLRWPVRAYLITEFIPDAVTLEHFLSRSRGLPWKLVYPLADLLARLHSQGFSHRDLKASNVLFDRDQQPWLIDLDGVRGYGRLPKARAVMDLARLAQELMVWDVRPGRSAVRFLRRYCRQRQVEGALRSWHQLVSLELQRTLAARKQQGRISTARRRR